MGEEEVEIVDIVCYFEDFDCDGYEELWQQIQGGGKFVFWLDSYMDVEICCVSVGIW